MRLWLVPNSQVVVIIKRVNVVKYPEQVPDEQPAEPIVSGHHYSSFSDL